MFTDVAARIRLKSKAGQSGSADDTKDCFDADQSQISAPHRNLALFPETNRAAPVV